MHRVIQWLKCVSVVIGLCMLKWKMTEAAPSCPNGFDCSGVENCYLIYPENGEWKYKDSDGQPHDTDDGRVYSNPNCYKFIKVTNTERSCIDAQRECERFGGNIIVLNSIAEYNQLTDNVEHVLSVGTVCKFNAHRNYGLKKCIQINVDDGYFQNDARRENQDCSQAVEINTIICESTDTYPVPSQSTTLVSELTKMSLVTSTSAENTRKGGYTISSKNNISPPHASEQHKSSANLVAAICVPLVVIILIVLLVCFLIRRKRKRPQMVDRDSEVDGNSIKQDQLQTGSHKHSAAVPSIDPSTFYHDTVVPLVNSKTDRKSFNQDTHQNEFHQLNSPKHGVAVPSIDPSTFYHDTVVPPVFKTDRKFNQDTHQNELYQLSSQKHGAAVPSIDPSTLYHDTVVPRVNSKTDRKSINQYTHQNELYQLSSQKHGDAVPSLNQGELYHDTVVKNEVYGLIS